MNESQSNVSGLPSTNESMVSCYSSSLPSEKQCIGVLVTVKELISQMSNTLRENEGFMNILFDCFSYCLSNFQNNSQIRTLALKRLTELFSLDLPCIDVEKISSYFSSFFTPKLQSFEGFCRDYLQNENSTILCLLVNFSLNPRYSPILSYQLIEALSRSIGYDFISLAVKEPILRILNRISSCITNEHQRLILESVSVFVKSFSTTQLKKNQEIFGQLFILIENLLQTNNDSSYSEKYFESMNLYLEIVTFICILLKKYTINIQSNQRISFLKIINSLIIDKPEVRLVIFENISEYIFYAEGSEMRTILCSIFGRFSGEISRNILIRTNDLLDCKDGDLSVFTDFKEHLNEFSALPSDESMLLIYNFMHFVGKNDDFVVRSNSVEVIKVIINQCKDSPFYQEWINTILNCIKSLLKSNLENVSMECYSIFQLIISASSLETLQVFNNGSVLFSDDGDSNYFSNIFHLQVHRRIRAINRLGSFIAETSFPSDIFCNFFLPVLHQFCYSCRS